MAVREPGSYRCADMGYDPRIHHRRSIRLRAWDYREVGPYFVTICTYQRVLLFDDLEIKALVEEVWGDVVCRHGRTADEFVVMPNHVHGIVWLSGIGAVGAQQPDVPSVGSGFRMRKNGQGRGEAVAAPLRRVGGAGRRESGSLGAIVRTFKAATAKRINNLRETRGEPVWQRNYYERVIRDEAELADVRQYILDNPRKWAEDNHNPAQFPVIARGKLRVDAPLKR